MMEDIVYFIFPYLLFYFVDVVEGRNCWYKGNGFVKKFYCESDGYCCGNHCCRAIYAFYRLWYFWISIILIFMFCSGGGYWYRRRYVQQRIFINHQTNVATGIPMSTRHTMVAVRPAINTNPISPGTGVCQLPGTYAMPPPPYPQAITDGTVMYTYPPGFYGPPPSYDSVY